MTVELSPGVTRLGIPVTVLLAYYRTAAKERPVTKLRVDGYPIWVTKEGDRLKFWLPPEWQGSQA